MELHYTWQVGRYFAPLLRLLHQSGFFDPAVYMSVATIPAFALFAWVLQRAKPEIEAASQSKLRRGWQYCVFFFMCWMAVNSFTAGLKTTIVEELAYQERKWFEPYLPAVHFYIASAFVVDLALLGKPVSGPLRRIGAAYLQLALLLGYGAGLYRIATEDWEGALAGVILLAFFAYRNYVLALRMCPSLAAIEPGASFRPIPGLANSRFLKLAPSVFAAVVTALFLSLSNDRDTSPSSQRAMAAETGSADRSTLGLEPEMVRIPAGEFLMGSEELTSAERPVHRVFLDSYYIGKFEVTNAQYKEFCDATGRPYPRARWSQHSAQLLSDVGAAPGNPVVGVTWDDALAYTQWLSQTTRKKYRLPTEAEWEKAARGGMEGMKYPWGDDPYDADGRYRANAGADAENDRIRLKDGFLFTAPVGSFPPNEFGLYDMAGNVWEWCADFYDRTYYDRSAYRNPGGPDGGDKQVVRGGSWFGGPEEMQNAARSWNYASIGYASTGFRVAMTP